MGILQKIGIFRERAEEDDALLEGLGKCLRLVETDMTLFYRKLAELRIYSAEPDDLPAQELLEPLRDAWYQPNEISPDHQKTLGDWLRRYIRRVSEESLADSERKALMNRINPKYVMRNYLAQLAIEKQEAGDSSVLHELMQVMQKPYDEQPGFERYAEKMPDWARHKAGCSMLSCSS